MSGKKRHYKEIARRQRRMKRLKYEAGHLFDRENKRLRRSNRIVRKNVLWAMGTGLVPVPLLDTGLASFVQIRMLSNLAYNYDVPFSKDLVKSLVATLLGYISVNSLRTSFISGMVKKLPYGNIWGVMTMPVYSGGATYAIGKIFVRHFEAGGTFINFNPDKEKKYFAELYREGVEKTSDLKNSRRNDGQKRCKG